MFILGNIIAMDASVIPSCGSHYKISASEINLITRGEAPYRIPCVFVHRTSTLDFLTSKARITSIEIPTLTNEIIWLLCLCGDGEKVVFPIRKVDNIVKVIDTAKKTENIYAKVGNGYFTILEIYQGGSSLYFAIKIGLKVNIILTTPERMIQPLSTQRVENIQWEQFNKECEVRIY
jgi:hypothetical protein